MTGLSDKDLGSKELNWLWSLHYAVAILLALVLGAILGSLSLFMETFLPGTRLRASDLVQFLGYAGALVLFWLVGQRAVAELRKIKNLLFLCPVIMPAMTLIVLLVGYKVVLLVAAPFLDRSGQSFYNWTMMAGIVSASFWLILAWLRQSAPLLEAMEKAGRTVIPEVSCPRCNALALSFSRFCMECGGRLSHPSA